MARRPYEGWSKVELLQRIERLESELRGLNESQAHKQPTPSPGQLHPSKRVKAAKTPRNVDPSKYSTRQIALRFAYLGQGYNGLEYHKHNDTPLPTVEETLWHALKKTQLIFPTVDPANVEDAISWEGCDYSKCGRTDRGVSAFGQVVALRVRSNRPVSQAPEKAAADEPPSQAYSDENLDVPMTGDGNDVDDALNEKPPFDDIKDELPYIKILNRVLPDDIRILAWCPAPTGFSARFSCRERRYRYFFTQPAFMTSLPTISSPSGAANGASNIQSSSPTTGHLNIQAMQAAASKFIGLHDFRNFCKIDASKQLENFERRIFRSEIVPIKTSPPTITIPDHNLSDHPPPNPPLQPSSPISSVQTFAFILHGSAFLWHQVRHMVAILFLIGQGFESPDLIDELLDIRKTPAKPRYEMADDAPLVLWDCIFPSIDTKPVDTTSKSVDGYEKGDHIPQEEQQRGYEDALPWITEQTQAVSQSASNQAGSSRKEPKPQKSDLPSTLWRLYRKSKIDCTLSEQLLTSASTLMSPSPNSHPSASGNQTVKHEHHHNSDDQETVAVSSQSNTSHVGESITSATSTSTRIFLGGNEAKLAGRYVPVMERPRGEGVESVNRRWREKMEMKDMKGRMGKEEAGMERGKVSE